LKERAGPIFGRRCFVVPAFAMLVLFWGSAFAAVKVGLDYSPPVLFAGMRSFVGGLTITAVALVWGGRPNLGRDWGVFVLLSLLNVVLFLGLQTFAVMLLPSGTAAVVIYLQPILIGVLAWFVLGEPLSAGKMLGLLLGFAGIVAVSSAGFSGEISAAGVAFAVVSALSWALGTVYFKKVQERVSMLWAVALPFLSGGILLSILGLATERPADISWSGPYVASLLYSGLVGTGLAWVLWLGLVRAGEASRVAAYVFFVPLVSVVIGAVFLHERLGLSLLVGAALVVSGIYLANRTPGEDKKTAEA
jgi:O-acetylserine/cysteine efflux transporter